MDWFEIRVITTGAACDAVSEALVSMGTAGVAIEDPEDIRREIDSPGSLDYADEGFLESLGTDVTVKAYFPANINVGELIRDIGERLALIGNHLDTGAARIEYATLKEEDWANNWKKYYKPVRVSGRITVKPSWEEYEKAGDEIVIELDPGMAFGTGTHETTRLCLRMLEKYVKCGDRVIDVGCGTGILSIAAVRLGAGMVTAVDVDEAAVAVTRENCRLNGTDAKVHAFRGSIADVRTGGADVIVANIIAGVIIDIAGDVYSRLKKGGLFICSGIIREKTPFVFEEYERKGFTCLESAESGEWAAMVLRCQSSS